MKTIIKVIVFLVSIPVLIAIAIFSNIKELLESNKSDFKHTYEFVLLIVLWWVILPYAIVKTSISGISKLYHNLKFQ